ncbi:unnamed protein product [Cylindrotheca closterium]|uniref:DUF547 domain-containing protein n=1 Tax=Cylindrotheca closterium TaxID=2856 RepID=A0AAD2CS16_9STRA|nr:unnamed protein product [Cylindrotheca closterium]
MQRVKKPFRKARGKLTRSASERKPKLDEDDIIATESQAYGTLSPPSLDNDAMESRYSVHSMRQSFRPSENYLDHDATDQYTKVQNLERVIRQIIIVFAAYILGTRRAEWATMASNMLGYIVTAWVTCVVILYILDSNKKKNRTLGRDMDAETQNPRGELEPLLSPAEMPTPTRKPNPPTAIPRARSLSESAREMSTSSSMDVTDEHHHAHPSLASLYIMDTNSGRRIDSNGSIIHLSNEWIEMDVLAMIRTPDADDPSAPMGTPENTKVSEYFRGRQRRFEFQFQYKLKKSVAGKNIYFAAELENPVKLGIVQRAFVSAAMAFMRKTNPSFHYSITGSTDKEGDGSWEKPHMAFTVLGSMDRLVISKPGEPIPELGSELYEDPEAIKQRKRGVDVDWNCEDTYTCALWSAYCDWIDWKIINLPGIRPFELDSVLGPQNVNIVLYMTDQGCTTHNRNDLYNILDLEFSCVGHCKLGAVAQDYCDARQRKLLQKPPTVPEDGADKLEDVDEGGSDDETGAELGEGIYMRSGDVVTLGEVTSGDTESTITIGGGFAVLQEQAMSTIVIQKARRSHRNRLLKSGDAVYFKLTQKKGTSTETRYLTTHRGWWLKWATSLGTSKNGYFTIHALDSGDDGKPVRSSESESDYLTMGSSFTLKHKRWSRYHIGVAAEPSPTYGGRMLSLYNPAVSQDKPPAEDQYIPDDDDQSDDELELDKKTSSGWMNKLVLCAQEPMAIAPPMTLSPSRSASRDEEPADAADVLPIEKLVFSEDHCHVDVPAWIETMNRTERIRQLTYVVRVTHSEAQGEDAAAEAGDDDVSLSGPANTTRTFARLRTGRELARIMMVGKSSTSVTKSATSSIQFSTHRRKSFDVDFYDDDISLDEDIELDEYAEDVELKLNGSQEEIEILEAVSESDESEDEEIFEEESAQRSPKAGRVTRGKRLIGKVAKTAKSATKSTVVGTGKLAVKSAVGTGKLAVGTGKFAAKTVYGTTKAAVGTGKYVAKGTLSAGKMAGQAVIAPITKRKPPKSEPKAKKLQGAKARLELSKKTMKKIEKIEKQKNLSFLAGELCAPEQSCRIASRVLSRMSCVPYKSSEWKKFNDVLVSQVAHEAEQDRWFLEGTAVQLGVAPEPENKIRGKLMHESLGARCLWESHWREEWLGIYDTCVSIYAPSTKSPCLEIALIDIRKVRPLDAGTVSPLPGFHLLVLETAWICHYVAFRDEDSRDTFGNVLQEAADKQTKSAEETASLLRNARFWQGFQTLSNSSLSTSAGKWAKVSCGSKALKERSVLNGRRMAFDINLDGLSSGADGIAFVENILSKSLSFDLRLLEEEPDSFVEFLDLTSRLRLIPLDEIDLSSKHAFCLFANIYHCLLQHAMLLSMNGPLDKKNMNDFMRTSCYEIGNDVFSLAELYCCVIRGKMSRPGNLKPPYPDVSKKSNTFRHYALDFKDPRINFILSTGDSSCPRSIPVLKPHDIEQQLTLASSIFLRKEVYVDARTNTVILPKICEVYKNDFGGDSTSCLRFCLEEVDEETAATIRTMMLAGSVSIRFQHATDNYHSSLQLRAAIGESGSLRLQRTVSQDSTIY